MGWFVGFVGCGLVKLCFVETADLNKRQQPEGYVLLERAAPRLSRYSYIVVFDQASATLRHKTKQQSY